MKITKNQLKQIIKEELDATLREEGFIDTAAAIGKERGAQAAYDWATDADWPTDEEGLQNLIDVSGNPSDPGFDLGTFNKAQKDLAKLQGRRLPKMGEPGTMDGLYTNQPGQTLSRDAAGGYRVQETRRRKVRKTRRK